MLLCREFTDYGRGSMETIILLNRRPRMPKVVYLAWWLMASALACAAGCSNCAEPRPQPGASVDLGRLVASGKLDNLQCGMTIQEARGVFGKEEMGGLSVPVVLFLDEGGGGLYEAAFYGRAVTSPDREGLTSVTYFPRADAQRNAPRSWYVLPLAKRGQVVDEAGGSESIVIEE